MKNKHLAAYHAKRWKVGKSAVHTINVNEVYHESSTLGQRVADVVAGNMGSWRFLIIQTAVVCCWIGSNIWFLTHPFDIYPFVLLNLLFSTQAAYSTPLIMMSQRRQSEKDHLQSLADYHINQASFEKLEEQNAELLKQTQILEEQNEVLKDQTDMLILLIRGMEKSRSRIVKTSMRSAKKEHVEGTGITQEVEAVLGPRGKSA